MKRKTHWEDLPWLEWGRFILVAILAVGLAGGGAVQGALGSLAKRSLRLELELNARRFAEGEPMEMTFRVTNPTQQTVSISTAYPGGYDFAVCNASGELWRWSYGKVFPAELGEIILEPGESQEFIEIWPQENNEGAPVGVGKYWAVGILVLASPDPPICTKAVRFHIH